MDHTVTRRSVVALAAAGLAGCLGSDSNGHEEEKDEDDDTDHDGGGDSRPPEPPERDLDPDWETASTFRSWLLEDTAMDGNRRFDYTEVFPEETDLGEGFPDGLGISTETVDGHLVQSFTQVFFGRFDAAAILENVADADDVEEVDEYAGYAVLEDEVRGETRRIAVGESAIVVGDDYERRIDAHRGEYERLEEADPEFTHLFRQLPHDETVTAHYGPPMADNVDIDGIYLWGVSSESPTADELTWVFVFAREEDLTEETVSGLETISGDVVESSMEGRTAIVVGAPPDA
ncbi:hypothetical protein [Natronobacterium gregoryi]|uniref:Uncharacterized protein n=2 Tax=Natronobacterium gregoryi TaxID=44930 RepID=L0AI89_NATGS|nr:hypothetical protein [Natronobacterium gregoryi]AFZ72892.1 hypothetical protein Natgr_1695 [Natronobacterium gregoryi SP2]ELY69681.1 hypothetical protein C490_07416 [Natronobacterium gregoryi SP2]PLK21880.1 hypothetical protein CYV19_01925 [Natronobacterium gregoryi SP2]SFI66636.1 hypothetical protein SAMN05443661_10360 [Natronobacterium gregoryi]